MAAHCNGCIVHARPDCKGGFCMSISSSSLSYLRSVSDLRSSPPPRVASVRFLRLVHHAASLEAAQHGIQSEYIPHTAR